jgi:hypothetical protein
VLLAAVSQRLFPCPYPFLRVALLLAFAGVLVLVGVHLPAWGLGTRVAVKLGLWLAYFAGSFGFGLVSVNDLRTVAGMVAGRLRGARPAGA